MPACFNSTQVLPKNDVNPRWQEIKKTVAEQQKWHYQTSNAVVLCSMLAKTFNQHQLTKQSAAVFLMSMDWCGATLPD